MNWIKLSATIILYSIATACNKAKDIMAPDGFKEYSNEAIVLGYYDNGCKHAYYINLINDDKYSKIIYADKMPDGAEINLLSSFPMQVVLTWDVDNDNLCNNDVYDYITIKKIEKVK